MVRKTLLFAVLVFVCSVFLAVSVSAQEYEFDVSSAVQSNGKWGQSFREDTPEQDNPNFIYNFDPLTLTKNSRIIAEYKLEGEAKADESPVELIWQTWDNGPQTPNPDVKDQWNKVLPFSYSNTSAVFAYEDIVEAFGTDDFSTVYAVHIGDAGVKLTLTKLTATELDFSKAYIGPDYAEHFAELEAEKAAQREAEAALTSITIITEAAVEETESVAETEAVTSEETAAESISEETTVQEAVTTAKPETTAVTYNEQAAEEAKQIAENAPKQNSSGTPAIIIVLIAVLSAAGGGWYIYNKRKNKF